MLHKWHTGIFWLALVTVLLGSCQEDDSQENRDQQTTDSLAYDLPELKYLNDAIRQDKGNAELWYQRAILWENLQEYARAEQDLMHAADLAPDENYIPLRLADLYLTARDQEARFPDSRKAIATLERFLKGHPDNLAVRLELARIHTIVMQYDKAERQLEEVLKRDKRNARAWMLRGNNYRLQGDTLRAINAYQTCVELQPENFTAHYELGLLFSGLGKDIALDYFDNALRIDSTNEDVYYARALFLQQSGRYREAIEAYRDMIRRNPQNEHALYNLGYIYFDLDSLDKAYRNFDLVTKIAPAYADAYYMRGQVAELQGNLNQARIDYIQTLNLDPEHELAHEGLDRIGRE